jgi:hypothetical protein
MRITGHTLQRILRGQGRGMLSIGRNMWKIHIITLFKPAKNSRTEEGTRLVERPVEDLVEETELNLEDEDELSDFEEVDKVREQPLENSIPATGLFMLTMC